MDCVLTFTTVKTEPRPSRKSPLSPLIVHRPHSSHLCFISTPYFMLFSMYSYECLLQQKQNFNQGDAVSFIHSHPKQGRGVTIISLLKKSFKAAKVYSPMTAWL